MLALQYSRYGGPEVLQCQSLPDPEPGPGEVCVRMIACGLAPVDTKLRAGMLQSHFSLHLPHIPGRDGVGVVEGWGPDVRGWARGDAVCVVADALKAGTCAQRVCVDASRLVPRPAGLSDHAAAVLMQPGISAWIAVTETAGVRRGMRVLVHGGAGAVGGLMVQLCHHLGAEVSATCRADNRDHVLALGATRVLAYDREDFSVLRDQDVVFDLMGGDTHARSYPVLRPGGRMVFLTAAPFVDQAAEFGVKVVRAAIADRPEVLAAVADLAARGIFQPRVSAVYPLAEAAKAHANLEAGRITRGRVALDIPPDTLS